VEQDYQLGAIAMPWLKVLASNDIASPVAIVKSRGEINQAA
jgi:hypothetical protein